MASCVTNALLLFVVTAVLVDADPAQNGANALMSAMVIDAAAMPLHWIYDVKQIASLVKDGQPEFFPTPSCPYYNYVFGENTPYGQQSRAYLELLANHPNSSPAPQDFEASYFSLYTNASSPCSTQNTGPRGHGCYWDGSTKEFVKNVQSGQHWPSCGGIDSQADSMVHAFLVAAKLAGKPTMLDEVETIIRVTQNTDDGVAFGMAAARILEQVILGATPMDAVTIVAKTLVDPNRNHPNKEDANLSANLTYVLSQLDRPNIDLCLEIGQSCDYPNNLLTGAHLLAQLSSLHTANPAAAFLNATRQTIMAGGDSGSRSMFVGAVLGAGSSSVFPTDWQQKYLHYDIVKSYIDSYFIQ